jgi:hypothetical protein
MVDVTVSGTGATVLIGNELVQVDIGEFTGVAQSAASASGIAAAVALEVVDALAGPNAAARPRDLAYQLPVIVDRVDAYGGGPAVYVPLTGIYFNVPLASYVDAPTAGNAESTEIPGYAKLTVGGEDSGVVETVFFNLDTLLYEVATFPTLPSGDTKPFVPIVTLWLAGRAVSPMGIPVRDTRDMLRNLIYPPHLFVVKDRPLAFYPENVFRERTDAKTFDVALVTSKGTDRRPYIVSAPDGFEIDGNRCGTSGYLISRQEGGLIAARQTVELTIHAGAATGTGTKRALFIGDSITNRFLAPLWGEKMRALGYTPQAIGTIVQDPFSRGNVAHEGREGIEWADYIYFHTDFASPLAPGGEAAYLALPANDQKLKNPFLRAATGGDPGAIVFNGYVWDLDFYLTRFGFADPDVVFVNLGTNDITQQNTATALGQVQAAFDIFYTQIRTRLPNAHIFFVANALARSGEGDARWLKHLEVAIVEQMKRVAVRRGDGDAKVWFVPGYAHVSGLVGFNLNAGTADSDTGVIDRSVTDAIHYTYGTEPASGADQMAEALVAWSHGALTGA